MRKILSVALLALLTLGVAQAQTADEIVTKYLNSIGGAAKWKALTSTKSTITLNQSGFDIPGYIVADSKNRERFQLEFQGMKMIQAFDGTTAWGMNGFQGQTAPAKLEGDQALAASDVEFLDEFIDYKKRGYSVELEGEKDLEGTACYALKLIKKEGDESIHYFDKESGLKIGELQTNQGQESLSLFSDYTETEGLKVPSKISQKMGGVLAFTSTINKTEFNLDIPDSEFAFPGN